MYTRKLDRCPRFGLICKGFVNLIFRVSSRSHDSGQANLSNYHVLFWIEASFVEHVAQANFRVFRRNIFWPASWQHAVLHPGGKLDAIALLPFRLVTGESAAWPASQRIGGSF